MTMYLITIKTASAIYEEIVEAQTSTLAAKKLVTSLVEQGELSPNANISYDWDFAD